jgi:type IV pilus assembly protein PilV
MPRHGCRGFTLVEVLVAVLVLSIGLLGIAGLQLNGMRNNHIAYVRTQATVLANGMLDRIRANRDAFASGDYDLAKSDAPAAPSGGATIEETDLYEWTQSLSTLLPSGDGAIVRNGDRAAIQVFWDGNRDGDTDDDGESFELMTEI